MSETPSIDDKEQFDPLGDVLSGVAERHQELQKQSTLKLFVPGYEGLMKVRYHLLPEAQMDRLVKQRREMKGDGITGEWELESQTIVDLCDAVEVRDPNADDGYLVLQNDDGPIRFERHFADLLEKKGIHVQRERAREIVLDFFCPREKPQDPSSPRLFPNAMDRHVSAIFAWYRGERDKIDRSLLGE